jgi:carboxyl-terminal processing protease
VRLPRNHVPGARLATSLLLLCASLVAREVRAADEAQILTPVPSSFEALSRFTELLEAVQKSYVQPSHINTSEQTTAALRGFVRAIDPEADLLSADEAASTNDSADSSGDIGISFAVRDDFPMVIAPRDGAPAQAAGLLPGEQIIAINDTTTAHARRIEVDRLLRGPPDSPVRIRVLDPGTGGIRDLRLNRTDPSFSAGTALRYLDKAVAYYRLSDFTLAAVENLRTAMIIAKSERAPGIILDLRDNPGGKFEAAQVAASFFLPKGTEVVSLSYANPGMHTTFVSDESMNVTAPLILLVNGGTAAEAEVFAAALQDNRRARIVGSKSFGRGILAASIRLSDGSVLVMPSAYFARPTKQFIQDKGLTPDVVVELPRETERALTRAGFGKFDWSNHRTEVLETDLPLAKAFLLLAK